MLKFNANLYRIAREFQSKEVSRYYLQGVQIEPHPVNGVLMVATDGARMIVVHDESGEATESAIIALSPEAMKACKMVRGEDRRVVTVDGIAATVHAFVSTDPEEKGEAVAVTAKCRIDGTFPDWRRVIPTPELPAKSVASFSGALLATIGKTAVELEKHFAGGDKGMISIIGTDAGSPHLILFGMVPSAFAVLMSVCGGTETTVPEWLNAKTAQAAE